MCCDSIKHIRKNKMTIYLREISSLKSIDFLLEHRVLFIFFTMNGVNGNGVVERPMPQFSNMACRRNRHASWYMLAYIRLLKMNELVETCLVSLAFMKMTFWQDIEAMAELRNGFIYTISSFFSQSIYNLYLYLSLCLEYLFIWLNILYLDYLFISRSW